MKPSEVTELVAILVAAFPRPPIGEKTIEVYERMLADLDRELAHRAVARLIATAKFLPTIAEIRAAATELTLGPRRLGGEAWGDVGAAIREFGRYQAPEFDDPLTAECVRQLGWLTLCDSTNDVADRARFVELYDGLALRQRADAVAGPALALPSPTGQPGGLKRLGEFWVPMGGGAPTELEAKRGTARSDLAKFDAAQFVRRSVAKEDAKEAW